MPADLSLDNTLAERLPLPLAQVLRRAGNAKTPRDRHDTAYYLWEAGLKLLASVAVVAHAERPERHDPALTERLQNLARPSIGHWCEFVRLLVPRLADAGVPGFAAVRELLYGKARDDLPRAAGLDAALVEALQGKSSTRSTVKLAELFDRLVSYRNREFGHGAAGQKAASYYEKVGRALLLGVAELFGRLDALAGHRLLYVAEVRRRADGSWIVERADLSRGLYQRVESTVLGGSEAEKLPRPDRLYLQPRSGGEAEPLATLPMVHPLLSYDGDTEEVLFLNARRGKAKVEYLSYTSGKVVERAELAGEQRELLRRVLDMPAEAVQVEAWQARSIAEDPTDAAEEGRSGTSPRQLGEFELLSKLGQGGMGIVYRARQPSLGRQVALKCLIRTGDPKAEARFAREINALGRVEHPNLVKLYASGLEGEHWFYAMELVEGTTLAAVCERLQAAGASVRDLDLPTWRDAVSGACEEARRQERPLSDPAATSGQHVGEPERQAGRLSLPTDAPAALAGRSYVRHVVQLLRQVCAASHALHEKGIIHRDVKPGNVMVTPDGSSAVLMDLGLAQLSDEVEGRLTKTRQFVGTLRYASPEQVLAVARLNPRSDVYSLGATLWELLTLRPLFSATEQTPTPELMQRIQFAEPGRLRKYHPGVPTDLDAIVLKCLEKDPSRRYASADELAADLERFLAGEPVLARPVGQWGRAWRRCRRNPAVAVLLTAVALLLLAGTGVSLFLADQANESARHATKKADEAARERERADREADAARAGLYAATMNLAQRFWNDAHVRRALELLESQQPENTGGKDLRGWEWQYLHRLCHPEVLAFKRVRSFPALAYSPDGQRLAGTAGQHIKVWDASTGRVIRTFEGHGDGVLGVAYSPDGQRLASASADKTVKVWDVESGRAHLTFKGHKEAVIAVTFSPDGTRLASHSQDGTVRVWDAGTGQETVSLRERTGFPQSSLAFSADGRRLATASLDRTVKVWDANSGERLLTLKGHTHQLFSVAFSPDGKWLASTSGDGVIKVWEAHSGKEARSLEGNRRGGFCVTFAPDSHRLACAADDDRENVKVWDLDTGKALLTVKEPRSLVLGLAFSPDGKRLAGAGELGIQVWDAADGRETLLVEEIMVGIRPQVVAFSPDGKHLACGGGAGEATKVGTVTLWDAATGRELLAFKAHTAPVYGLGFSGDGKRVATLGGGVVKVWEAADGRELLAISLKTRGLSDLAFSPDGELLATTAEIGEQRVVKVWSARSGREVRTLRGQGRSFLSRGLAFSPDSRRLAGAGDREMKVWDLASGKEVGPIKGNTNFANGVAFSPDGKRLACACQGEVKVWEVATGQLARALKGGGYSVAFSPDGSRLASASGDRLVRVWDTASGQEALTLKGHASEIYSVAFSPDGTRLASAGVEGVKVWDATRGPEGLILKGHQRELRGVAFSPDGGRLASATDAEVKVCDARTGREERSFPRRASGRADVAFGPGGNRLAAASQIDFRRVVKVWEVGTGQEVFTLQGPKEVGEAVAWSPDGRILATAAEDRLVKLWDGSTGKELRTLQRHTSEVRRVVFSPDGKRLASGCDALGGAGQVIVWDAHTGREIVYLAVFGDVTDLAFHPDGRRLAGSVQNEPGSPGQVLVWDLDTGQEALSLRGHTAGVKCVAFSPDGKRLATGSLDKTIKVWDAASGQEVLSLKDHTGAVFGVAFSPDGRRLASASTDGTVRVREATAVGRPQP